MNLENQTIAKQLSNSDLLARLGKLVRTERKITHLILECVAEIDSRKLYLEKAYPSLYEFLIKEFGYSPSAAVRRIESARLLREIPEISTKIQSGALNLTQLSQMQHAARQVQKSENRAVDVSEKKQLLSKIEHTTQAKTELILAQELALPVLRQNKETTHRDESVTLTITFSKEQMALLEQAQDLISHAVPEKKWAEVITYLAKKEVKRRTNVKSKKNNLVATSKKERLRASALATVVKKNATSFVRKPLPATIKKSILQEQRCCQYKDPSTGKHCTSTRFLQIDHIQSVSAGGSNNRANLQVLCGQHNRFKFQKEIQFAR